MVFFRAGGVFSFNPARFRAAAVRMISFRARSLILSPSWRSIARHLLPPSPLLKSLSGSGRLAPSMKVSFS